MKGCMSLGLLNKETALLIISQLQQHELSSAYHLFLLVSWVVYSLTLKMEAVFSSKTSGSLQLHGDITQKAIPFTVTIVRTSNLLIEF
jgi:hypothetical protein